MPIAAAQSTLVAEATMSREVLTLGRALAPVSHSPRDGPVLELVDALVTAPGCRVLDGVSMQVRAGEVVGVLGSPAAGPFALLSVLAGELRPRHAVVRHCGADVSREPSWRRAEVGIVHTLRTSRLVAGSVRDNVRLALQPHRRTHRVDETIASLGLADLAMIPIDRLEWPTRRKVELAVALASDPSVLLVDDLGSGLGAPALLALVPVIRDLCRQRGLGVVVADSYAPFVLAVADWVICLFDGRIVLEGRPSVARCSPEVTRTLLGQMPSFRDDS